MKVVSAAKAKCSGVVQAVVCVSCLGAAGTSDYILRHEVKGKARRALVAADYQLGAGGIIRAIQEDNLELFKEFDTAKISYAKPDSNGVTPLHYAVASQKAEAIDELLEDQKRPEDQKRRKQVARTINKASTSGKSAFKHALEQRDYDLADRLLDLGADINLEREPGQPWLVHAIESEQPELQTFLIDRGIDVNAKGTQPHPPLAMAAARNDLPLMESLTSKGADISINGTKGKTLLLEAIFADQREEIAFLLEKGVDTNAKGSHDHPPLAVAAANDDLPLMTDLQAHGAEVEITGATGEPLMHEALLANQYDEVAFLLDKGANPDTSADSLLTALEREDGFLLEQLISHGAKLDRTGRSGDHLLFEAYDRGDIDWLMQLVDSGISADLPDKDGQTLFAKAAQNGEYDLLDFVIAKGADVNQNVTDEQSATEHAVAHGDLALLRTMAQAGAHIDFANLAQTAYQRRDHPTLNLLLNGGMPPEVKLPASGKRLFDLAMEDRSIDTARSLLRKGADIKGNFWTALQNGMEDIVVLFLKEGEDPTQRGPNDETPLEYALNQEMYSLVKPLLDAGAHASATTDSNETWLAKSIRTGDSKIAMALLNARADLGDERTIDGHSMLGWAIANEMSDVALALIKAGADVNIIEPDKASSELIKKFSDSSKFTYYLKVDRKIRPVMMAAAKRNHVVARAMINAGCRNYPSARSLYPVAIGAWTADVRMMQILFNRNPDYQPRKLEVNLSSQRVKLYQNGKLIHSSVCSTGKRGYATKTGSFVITQKNRHHVSNLYDAEMPYFMRLSCDDFGFHTGVCPGYPASHGCIRLPNSTAAKFFNICSLGDLVVIRY